MLYHIVGFYYSIDRRINAVDGMGLSGDFGIIIGRRRDGLSCFWLTPLLAHLLFGAGRLFRGGLCEPNICLVRTPAGCRNPTNIR